MKIFIIEVVMWWSNVIEQPHLNTIEIESKNHKLLFFSTEKKCYQYVQKNIDDIKSFGYITFPTANAIIMIKCIEKKGMV